MIERFLILVPYRDRALHLTQAVLQLEFLLQNQPFDILVVEQTGNKPFNKGLLLNAGYRLAARNYRYAVFHDVDQLPLSADYSRPKRGAVHLGTRLSQYGFKLPYRDYMGGVVLFTPEQFESINGFSNHFWGWGCEDDDLRLRCRAVGLPVVRRNGRFISLAHSRDKRPYAKNLRTLLKFSAEKMFSDGLNTAQFKVVSDDILRTGHHLNGFCQFPRGVRRLRLSI